MKYKEKDRWFIDVELICDRNEFTTGAKSDLTAAQVEYCVSELCKVIGAPATPITPASVFEDEYEDGDGEASGNMADCCTCQTNTISTASHFGRTKKPTLKRLFK